MRFEVRLAQGARVFDRSRQEEIPLRTYASILAALAGSLRPLGRDEVIDLVWPEASRAAGRNRLRVALANLRKRLPNAIVESPAGLALNPDVVQIDLLEIAARIRQAEDTVTSPTEFEALGEALAPLGQGDGVLALRTIARPLFDMILAAVVRHFELAQKLKDVPASLASSRLAANISPETPDLWEAFLNVHWKAGRIEDALAWFRLRASTEVQKDAALHAVLRRVRSSTEPEENPLSADEAAVMLEMIQRLEKPRPDLWRTLLSAPEARVIAGRHPRIMHDLLQRAVSLGPGPRDDIWELSAARLCGLKAWLSDASGVLTLAEEILRTSQNPTILRAVWNTVAIAHSINRDWEPAFEALDKTAEYARRTGNEIDVISTEGNRAFFLMHQGRFDESQAEYRSLLDRLESLELEQARFEIAVAKGNSALISVYRRDWDAALAQLESAIVARSEPGMNLQMGLLQSALALAHAQRGQIQEAPGLLRRGFVDAFGAESTPTQQATFEFAAGTLANTSQAGFATAVLEWVADWRCRTGTPRSKAEADLCLSLGLVRATEEKDLGPAAAPPAVGRELMRRLRAEAARSGRS